MLIGLIFGAIVKISQICYTALLLLLSIVTNASETIKTTTDFINDKTPIYTKSTDIPAAPHSKDNFKDLQEAKIESLNKKIAVLKKKTSSLQTQNEILWSENKALEAELVLQRKKYDCLISENSIEEINALGKKLELQYKDNEDLREKNEILKQSIYILQRCIEFLRKKIGEQEESRLMVKMITIKTKDFEKEIENLNKKMDFFYKNFAEFKDVFSNSSIAPMESKTLMLEKEYLKQSKESERQTTNSFRQKTVFIIQVVLKTFYAFVLSKVVDFKKTQSIMSTIMGKCAAFIKPFVKYVVPYFPRIF